MYFLLGSRRDRIRTIAREAYLKHPYDVELAKQVAKDEIKTKSIVINFLLGLAIKLAIALIEYWFFKGIKNPPLFFHKGEPGV